MNSIMSYLIIFGTLAVGVGFNLFIFYIIIKFIRYAVNSTDSNRVDSSKKIAIQEGNQKKESNFNGVSSKKDGNPFEA